MQEVLFTYENCYVMVFVELQNLSSRKITVGGISFMVIVEFNSI